MLVLTSLFQGRGEPPEVAPPGGQTQIQAGSGPGIAGELAQQAGFGDAGSVSLLFLLIFTFNL